MPRELWVTPDEDASPLLVIKTRERPRNHSFQLKPMAGAVRARAMRYTGIMQYTHGRGEPAASKGYVSDRSVVYCRGARMAEATERSEGFQYRECE